MPTSVLNYNTPINCFKQYFPETRIPSNLPPKIFGCTVYVHLSGQGQSKQDPRAEKCVFIGYAPNKKGLDTFITMDVKFIEHQPYFQKIPFLGENQREEIFWETIPTPLPLPKIVNCENENATVVPSSSLPGITHSSTGGEVQNAVLRVYTRKKNHKKCREPTILLAPTQSDTQVSSGSRN